jgi:hypothetical protein
MKQALSVAALLLAAGCDTLAPQALAPLGPDPVLSGGTYSSGGGITVAVDLREANGRTLVCGVWAQSRRQSVLTNGVEPRLLGSGSVVLGREVLLRGLLFMREVPPMADYAGQEAGCVLSARPWVAGDEGRRPEIRIPRQNVYVDADEGGTVIVTFVQTGPGAGDD